MGAYPERGRPQQHQGGHGRCRSEDDVEVSNIHCACRCSSRALCMQDVPVTEQGGRFESRRRGGDTFAMTKTLRKELTAAKEELGGAYRLLMNAALDEADGPKIAKAMHLTEEEGERDWETLILMTETICRKYT